jgi:hypothetical protein
MMNEVLTVLLSHHWSLTPDRPENSGWREPVPIPVMLLTATFQGNCSGQDETLTAHRWLV